MRILGDSFLYNITLTISALLAIVIIYFKWRFTYWKRRGLYGPEPTILFGNVKDWILQKKNVGHVFAKLYNELKNKGLRHGGVYLSSMPCYIPVDMEIIKLILQKDFQYFMNRGMYINEEVDPLSGHLFNLEDQKWKNLRAKLTPTFTSGKMKIMFQTMIESTKELNMILEEESTTKFPVDIKDVVARFTTNIIGSCAFGLECDCFNSSDNQFRKYGKRIFEHTTLEGLRSIIGFFLPRSVLKLINFKSGKPDVDNFFINLAKNTVKYRETNNVIRKDFIHFLLQLKNRGELSDDNKIISDSTNNTNNGLTMKEFAAQCFVFYGAGFETSSTTMTFTLFELTQNLEIQDKLRNEINQVLEKHNENLTYDACMEMTYLDKVIYETLRKYPPVQILNRMCNTNYKIPNSDLCIENGTHVVIPTMAIHYDPEYYPNPEQFDPERFNEENKRNRPAFAWLPFGEGPRICIGLRFGMLQAKVGLVTILKNYRVTLNEKTKLPLKYEAANFILSTKQDVLLNFEKII